MLAFEFMRRALLVGVLLGVLLPGVGTVMVLRRLSLMGDALAHTSLAGVAFGLVIGANPVAGAVIACLLSALLIELIRGKIPAYGDLALAVVLSAGVGTAGVLSGLGGGAAGLGGFLFGSIVAISGGELAFVAVAGLVAGAVLLLFYRELLALSFDERTARLSGVPVAAVRVAFTLVSALVIGVAARTVGALVVSSMMVLPVACALRLGKGFKATAIAGCAFGLCFTLFGLSVSFYAGLRPGGTIVLIGVAALALIFILTSKRRTTNVCRNSPQGQS